MNRDFDESILDSLGNWAGLGKELGRGDCTIIFIRCCVKILSEYFVFESDNLMMKATLFSKDLNSE